MIESCYSESYTDRVNLRMHLDVDRRVMVSRIHAPSEGFIERDLIGKLCAIGVEIIVEKREYPVAPWETHSIQRIEDLKITMVEVRTGDLWRKFIHDVIRPFVMNLEVGLKDGATECEAEETCRVHRKYFHAIYRVRHKTLTISL